MMNTDEEQLDEEKKRFLLKHWKMTLVMAACIIAAVVVALLVFLWVVNEAALVMPSSLGNWTIGYIVTFILHLIFWELLLVATWGIPLAAVLYWQFSKLPDAEIWKPGRGRREEGDAFGFLIAVAWLIMIWIDGRWNQTFEVWTFTEWIYSWLTALGWVLLIFGIPAVIILVLWLVNREMKKDAEARTEPVDEVADEPSDEATD
ncbi:MAG: hypothetical protein PVJ05_13255 [Candidatus Thorarchaeota archaeon]|jgi:hypothetical protein